MLKTPGGTKTLHGCTGQHKMNEIGNYQGEFGTSMPKMNVVLSPTMASYGRVQITTALCIVPALCLDKCMTTAHSILTREHQTESSKVAHRTSPSSQICTHARTHTCASHTNVMDNSIPQQHIWYSHQIDCRSSS